ncbi:MAG: molybdopterin-dependent oxidoreductase [Chloroflexi bacterium]|nr:molybdopterin-dependent oxidoreductase [Chloroflexota bacterium]
MNEVVTKALCRWCHARCRVAVHSDNGRLVRIEEDPSDPRAGQMIPPTRGCIRLSAAREYVNHPDRIRFPLKRRGEKGENKWERITWDEALDGIAGQLKTLSARYGPETVFVTEGTNRSSIWTTMRFLNLFGSPNPAGPVQICFGPVVGMGAAMFGWPLRTRAGFTIPKGMTGGPPTKSALFIGTDLPPARMRVWKSLLDVKKLGTKIIVVDPRKTQTAEAADIWLQPRPGTDAALLLAMINVVIEEGLHDKEFVRKWCYGFDKLAERVRDYPPERVAEITWVPADKIREAARLYATNRPGVSFNGMGMEQLEDHMEAIQSRMILAAILGNIDVEGGEYVPGPTDIVTEIEMELPGKLSPEQKKKQLGSDRFRMLTWPGRQAISESNIRFWGKESATPAYAHYPSLLRAVVTGRPYPVRAGISVFSNPMLTQANTKLVYKALKSLDLYVVKDFWLTPSAQLADYVLPSACWLERPELQYSFGMDTRITGGEAALPAKREGEFDYRTEYDFFRGLGVRLGQEDYWPWESLRQAYDHLLQPLGMDFTEFMEKKNGMHGTSDVFRKYELKEGFGTPTRKLELYSTVLEKLGYDPLPAFHEPKESPISRPDLARDYPLMLITGGRFQPYFHSEYRQIESIRKRRPDPRVQVHPETAKELGIEDGDWIWIETPRGRIRQRCVCFDGIDPRVVHAEHGWWFPELPGEEPWLGGVWESNVNVLTDDDPERCNQRSGGWPLKTALCKIYPCKTY